MLRRPRGPIVEGLTKWDRGLHIVYRVNLSNSLPAALDGRLPKRLKGLALKPSGFNRPTGSNPVPSAMDSSHSGLVRFSAKEVGLIAP